MTASLAYSANPTASWVDLPGPNPVMVRRQLSAPPFTGTAAPTGANTVGAPSVTSLVIIANAPIVAVSVPIDRNDHVGC
ncbi:hypothetical protein MMAN_30600 [Mycobacterium mantenii]|uniref:Uncharacterized protein n=1 Tax=Mycobacterium mantenii TaxID=560555 RepID=A0ABN6ABD1_MYCNT|nr:hypothetical protein MMAN_30600 [Mycobacterium mantenii]